MISIFNNPNLEKNLNQPKSTVYRDLTAANKQKTLLKRHNYLHLDDVNFAAVCIYFVHKLVFAAKLDFVAVVMALPGKGFAR